MAGPKLYNPFIRSTDSTRKVMGDVVTALLPVIAVPALAYGYYPLIVVLVCVGSALTTEYLFNMAFRRDSRSLSDGSAVVTGILLACTVGALTPLHIVVVGGAAAVLFGKLLWGGLGRNRFNPALIGREYMVVLFPAVLNSPDIWGDYDLRLAGSIDLLTSQTANDFIFNPIGAIGEYSPLLIIAGALFLLWRRRISWHIPVAMFGAFTVLIMFTLNNPLIFSFGGLLLGGLYMATDMPTSASNLAGKVYFGAMTGIAAALFLVFDVEKGFLSYAILLMNAFVPVINFLFRPRVFGHNIHYNRRIWKTAILTAGIMAAVFLTIWLHKQDYILWVMLAFATYSIIRFVLEAGREKNNISDLEERE